MAETQLKPNSKLSKFLSLILRHKPEVVGLALDPQGWVSIDVLIAKCSKAGTRFKREELLHVVESNDSRCTCQLTRRPRTG